MFGGDLFAFDVEVIERYGAGRLAGLTHGGHGRRSGWAGQGCEGACRWKLSAAGRESSVWCRCSWGG
ncbi:hypothetical protein I552_0681 [Mycobacterium xenopi 3993]|nr:hypothetical protein I552_0681 [Mycobacterium xenopi 3993]